MANKLKVGNKRIGNNFGNIILKLKFTQETEFSFKLKKTYHFNCMMIWGDGTKEKLEHFETDQPWINDEIKHTYQEGTYYLTINGLCESINFTHNSYFMK